MLSKSGGSKARGLTLLVATAALTGGALLGTAAPAQASISQCGAGKFCAWNNAPYSGYLNGWSGASSNWGGSSNKATSIYNHGNSCGVRFYDGTSYTGSHGDLARGDVYEQLASWWILWPTINFDNRISSHLWTC